MFHGLGLFFKSSIVTNQTFSIQSWIWFTWIYFCMFLSFILSISRKLWHLGLCFVIHLFLEVLVQTSQAFFYKAYEYDICVTLYLPDTLRHVYPITWNIVEEMRHQSIDYTYIRLIYSYVDREKVNVVYIIFLLRVKEFDHVILRISKFLTNRFNIYKLTSWKILL